MKRGVLAWVYCRSRKAAALNKPHLQCKPRNGSLVRRSTSTPRFRNSIAGFTPIRVFQIHPLWDTGTSDSMGYFHNTEELFRVKMSVLICWIFCVQKGRHLQQSLTVGACSCMDSQRASGLESAAQRAAPQ